MDNYYINLAKEQAKKSDHINFRHGAVLTNGKKILSLGHNTQIRNINQHNINFRSIHAEMLLLLNFRKSRKKHETSELIKNNRLCVYVVRVSTNGNFRYSKPCEHCTLLLKKNNIKKVYYSTDEDIKCMYL